MRTICDNDGKCDMHADGVPAEEKCPGMCDIGLCRQPLSVSIHTELEWYETCIDHAVQAMVQGVAAVRSQRSTEVRLPDDAPTKRDLLQPPPGRPRR